MQNAFPFISNHYPLYKNMKGAFIFYKDNGEAMAYVLDKNAQDLNGKLRSLFLIKNIKNIFFRKVFVSLLKTIKSDLSFVLSFRI